jgi:hypothetical protein
MAASLVAVLARLVISQNATSVPRRSNPSFVRVARDSPKARRAESAGKRKANRQGRWINRAARRPLDRLSPHGWRGDHQRAAKNPKPAAPAFGRGFLQIFHRLFGDIQRTHILPDLMIEWSNAAEMPDDALDRFIDARLDLVLTRLREYLPGVPFEVIDTRSVVSPSRNHGSRY